MRLKRNRYLTWSHTSLVWLGEGKLLPVRSTEYDVENFPDQTQSNTNTHSQTITRLINRNYTNCESHLQDAFSPRIWRSAYAQRCCRKRTKRCDKLWWNTYEPQRSADTSGKKRAGPISQLHWLTLPHSFLAQVIQRRRLNLRRRIIL